MFRRASVAIRSRRPAHNIVWDNSYKETYPKPLTESRSTQTQKSDDFHFIDDHVPFGFSDSKTSKQDDRQTDNTIKRRPWSSFLDIDLPLVGEPDFTQIYGGDKYEDVQSLALHPAVFNYHINQENIAKTLDWQKTFKQVDMSFEQDRMEVGEKVAWKPWIGSGEGYERVKDKTGPRFVGGSFTAHPRRPYISKYYKLDRNIKISALCSCLTIKLYQDDLIVLSEFNDELVSKLQVLAENEPGCTFMIVGNFMSPELSEKLENSTEMNVFGLDGLNVQSLLKYDKLVLDIKSLRKLEAKMHFELTRYNLLESHSEPEHPLLDRFWQDIMGKWKDEKFNQGGYRSGHHSFYKDWPDFSKYDDVQSYEE